MQKLDLSNTKTAADRLEEVKEERNNAREQIKQLIRLDKYLKPAPNHNGNTGYCCPLCKSGTHRGRESTGAVEYFPQTNTAFCYSCRRPVDVFDALREQTGADYSTVLSLLAQEAGIDLQQPADKKKTITADQRERYKQAAQSVTQSNAKSAGDAKQDGQNKTPAEGAQSATEASPADYMAYYAACRERLKDPAAVSYLTARGISYETAYNCWIGYDPAADPASAPGAMGNEYKPHACPRIIIPTSKAHYVGRRTDGKDEFAKINAKGSSPGIFNSAILNNPKLKYVFVCEGAFDAMSVIETKHNAIALNSANNAGALINQLEENAQAGNKSNAMFILCLDNDDAGKAATETIKEGLRKLEIPFYTGNICGKWKDPNEALVSNSEVFSLMIETTLSAAKELREILESEEPQDASGDQAEEKPAEEPAADELTAFIEKIQTEAYKPYRTELSFFDELLGGGVIRQTLLLLMAAPGTGKTTLCAQIAEEMATHGKPVIYINLEMSREQMLAKSISSRATRNGEPLTALQVLQGYNWTDKQRQAVIKAVTEYGEKVRPYLSYNPEGIGSDLDAIRDYLTAAGEKAKAAGQEAPVIILDYLHLISSKAGLDAQELVKQAILMLKQYAIEYNTFVIGISATNRASNTAGRITLESGRDSSSLEYTADYQISLNYYEIDKGEIKQTDKDYNERIAKLQQEKWRRMIIRVLKGRFCAPGKAARVYFDAENNVFYGENDFMPADNLRTPFDNPKAAGNGQNIIASF